jgi:quercetin dioxygenase-like cupin family protein
MSANLDKLQKLTPKLTPIPFPKILETNENVTIHEMSCGTSIAFGLLQQDEISVARWFNSAFSEFPTHSHTQREWLIIYKGSMMLTIEDEEEQRLLPGQFVTIPPNTLHKARFLEDCWYLAITIPKTEEWPKARSGNE